MLQVGKTYRDKKNLSKRHVYILSRLADQGDYLAYAVYHVDPDTKETEVGEFEIRKDAVDDMEEVKE